MPVNERHVDAARGILDSLFKQEHYDRARKVDRGLDNEGKPVIDPRDFLSLRSPDGSVWRVRIDNAGVLSAKKEA